MGFCAALSVMGSAYEVVRANLDDKRAGGLGDTTPNGYDVLFALLTEDE